jgi:hypothetical protein
MPQTVLITSYSTLMSYISDETKEILAVNLLSENLIMLQFKSSEDTERHDGKGNVFVGCFTTAYARLKLYAEMEKVGDRVLYFDTGT